MDWLSPVLDFGSQGYDVARQDRFLDLLLFKVVHAAQLRHLKLQLDIQLHQFGVLSRYPRLDKLLVQFGIMIKKTARPQVDFVFAHVLGKLVDLEQHEFLVDFDFRLNLDEVRDVH